MRPVELKLSGLRSYRTEQVIDFTGVELMAIIGDTGAGKSSLLEAMCFALYGQCTWAGTGGGPLIAANGDGLLRVEFTFRVKGETWRVVRVASRRVSPPHHLKCLNTGEELDGSRKVTDKITELVGFDAKTFLKAVMLPQGKFQELLQSGESERSALLKSVLDLDSVSEVRVRAKAMADRLTPLLHDTEIQRERLPPDPARDMADASHRFTEASEVLGRLDLVRNGVAETRERGEAAGRRERELRLAGKRLCEKSRDDLHDDFADLITADARFAVDQATVQQELELQEGHVQRFVDALADAEDRGIGVGSTASALTTLAALAEQLPAWHAERASLEAESTAIVESLAELDEREQELVGLKKKAQEAQETVRGAAIASNAATTNVRECRSLLATAREKAGLAIAAEERVNGLRDEVKQLGDDLDLAAGRHQETTEALISAQDLLLSAQRDEAVAHAAAGSNAGDLCPVCTRTLPESFQPPHGADIATAEKAVEEAKKAHTTTDKAVRQAEGKRNKADGELEREIKAAELADGARDQSMTAVSARLGDVDLEDPDDDLLTDAITSADVATAATETAVTALQAAQGEHSDLRTRINIARPLITEREQRAATVRGTLGSRWKAIEDRLHEIPFFSGGEVTSAAITAAIEQARAQKSALTGLVDQKAEAETNTRSSQKKLEKLRLQHHEQVKKPRAELVQELSVLVERASVVMTALNREGIPGRMLESTLSDDAAWAAEVMKLMGSALEACFYEADACNAQVVAAQEEIATAYSSVEVPDEEQLETLIRKTNFEMETARNERQVAERALPMCQELDARLAAARPVVHGLRELTALLADGKFVGSVVRRRQRKLLTVASRILESMTDGRFGFAEDFRIIDTNTAQVRDVKTLSGGETFLASLALALALVEITSRGAGRVEALFLDEGFGTLDANALNWALEELHHNAGDGRLVAVISHMRDVAVNFTNILMVEKSPRGSNARWLSPEERDELVADDLAAGLRA